MRENRKNGKLCLVALALGLLATLGCKRPSPSSNSSTITSSTVVRGVHPKRQQLLRVVEQPGTVQAYEETQLFARVPGYVRLFHDSKGRIVHDIGKKITGPTYDPSGKVVEKPGEVLAELVVPELVQEAQLKNAMTRNAEADVEQARKAVAAATANIATMEAAVVEARSLSERWESEWKRFVGLVKSGTVAHQSRDETEHQFKAAAARVLSADAAVLKAKADRDKAEAEVRSTLARVDVARADALRSEAMLEYAQLRAPYDGIVTGRKANTGDFVQPAAGKGDWLFTVARLDPVRIVIAVPEADAELVDDQSTVELTVQSLPGPTRSGPVARTSWSLDQGARTLRAEVDLPNKDARLRPGMYVHARITNPLPMAWTLPVSAIVPEGDAMVCFLIEGDKKAVKTPVLLGRSDGKLVQVLKLQRPGAPGKWDDFTENDAVAARAAGLTDGQAVELEASGK